MNEKTNETLTGEAARDGAGQPLRVGDRVAGVRLEPSHTVVGRVVRLGAVTCMVRVGWVSDPDPELGAYGLARRARVGDETRVHLTRTFRLGTEAAAEAESDAGTTEDAAGGGVAELRLTTELAEVRAVAAARETRVRQLETQLAAALRRGFEDDSRTRLAAQLARAMGLREGTPWLASLATAIKLRTRVDELGGYVGAGVTSGDGLTDDARTVLNRVTVRLTYQAALNAAFNVAVSREAAVSAMTDAVMGVRDRELRMLRQRLDLADQLHQLDLQGEDAGRGEGAEGACAGDETVPNRCSCGCEGCRYHCGAHRGEDAQAGGAHPAGCRCNEPYPCGREGEDEDGCEG